MDHRKFTIGQYRFDIMFGRFYRLTTYKRTAYVKRIGDGGPDCPPGVSISIQAFRCGLYLDIHWPSQKERPRIFTGSDGDVYSIHEARLLTPVERQTLFGYDPLAAMERSA